MSKANITGCILGTAVGDSLGLPYEGLSRQRALKLFGPPNPHRFFFGYGMISDDTEHTCLTAQSLIDSGGETEAFNRWLCWRLRFWLLGVPAGIGLATLRSLIKLWLGFGFIKSGVHSAGNGPAIRSAIIGASTSNKDHLRKLVKASTEITHTDLKAEYGAYAVALAASMANEHDILLPNQYLTQLKISLGNDGNELVILIEKAIASAAKGNSTQSFADSLGLTKGVSGYVYHTVPVALHACFLHPQNFEAAVKSVIECGGDADSTAAIVGGILGAYVGKEGIPKDWLNHICEWPRTVGWMERLGDQLHDSINSNTKQKSITAPFWGILIRNFIFVFIVLFHGFRRLFPPY